MLKFFRTYQKAIFLVVAILVSCSMIFFGATGPGGGQVQRVDNSVVMTLPSGQRVTRDTMEKMVRFLTESYLTQGGEDSLPLHLHDGVLEKDFLSTGWSYELTKRYAELLQPEFAKRVAEEKKFQLYQHPHVPTISMQNLWMQSVPEINTAYDQFEQALAKDPLSKEAFAARSKLYLANRQLPESLMRRILLYQQNVYAGEQVDPALYHMDLSLFGYKNFEDWFGKKLAHLTAQAIFYFADQAKLDGIHVTAKEAEQDFLYNVQGNFQAIASYTNVTQQALPQLFSRSLQMQGLTEQDVIKLWQEVMLFRKWKKEVADYVLVDNLSLESFQAYAGKEAEVKVYSLPETLQLSSDEAKVQLAAYIHAVTKNAESLTLDEFAKHLLSQKEVAKKYPEMVSYPFTVEVKHLSVDDHAASVTVKETLAWQLDAANWKQMQESFPELAILDVTASTKERLLLIRNLPENIQGDLDRFARRQLVMQNQEALSEALQAQDAKQEEWLFLANSQMVAGPFREKKQDLLAKLQEAEEGSSFTWESGHDHYLIQLESKQLSALLSFEQAKHYRLLGDLVEKVKASVDDEWITRQPEQVDQTLHAFVQQAHQKALQGEDLSSFTLAKEGYSAANQWYLKEKLQTISRSDQTPFLNPDKVFELQEEAFSDVAKNPMGDHYFYQVLGFSQAVDRSKGFAMQEELAEELSLELFSEELSQLEEKQSLFNLNYLDKTVS